MILGAALAAAMPLAGAAETLTDTLISAYRNSDLLAQQRAVVRASDEDVAQAVAALRPVIALNGNMTDSYRGDISSTLSMTADLLIYDGGVSRLAIEAARESVLATRAALVEREQNVLLDAVTAYMDFRREVQALDISQNNVRVILRELEAARDRFEVGEITRTDVSQAEARLAEARSNLALVRGNVEVARAAFNLAVGRFPGDRRNTTLKVRGLWAARGHGAADGRWGWMCRAMTPRCSPIRRAASISAMCATTRWAT
jgi:outer membrane protein